MLPPQDLPPSPSLRLLNSQPSTQHSPDPRRRPVGPLSKCQSLNLRSVLDLGWFEESLKLQTWSIVTGRKSRSTATRRGAEAPLSDPFHSRGASGRAQQGRPPPRVGLHTHLTHTRTRVRDQHHNVANADARARECELGSVCYDSVDSVGFCCCFSLYAGARRHLTHLSLVCVDCIRSFNELGTSVSH